MKKSQNYRGVIPANIVVVLEGDGTPESPYEEVRYVLAYSDTDAGLRQITVGKILALTEEEKSNFRFSSL